MWIIHKNKQSRSTNFENGDDDNMCNKYAEHSKVQYKNMAELVTKCNSIDFDFNGKVKNLQCLTCCQSCIDFEFNISGNCENYKQRMSLKQLNEEIRIQNVNLRRFCEKHNLHYGKMKDMLRGKQHMKFKYYKYLVERLEEKEKYLEYVDKFDREVNYGEK